MSKVNPHQLTIGVIGAGFASLAFCLSQRNDQSVTLLESGAPHLSDSLDRQLVLSSPNLARLERWGVRLKQTVPITKVRVRELGSPRQLRFSPQDTMLPFLGSVVSANELLPAMRAQTQKKNIECINECRVSNIQYDPQDGSKSKKPFVLTTNKGSYSFSRLVVAGGSQKLLQALGTPHIVHDSAHISTAKIIVKKGLEPRETYLGLSNQSSVAVVPRYDGCHQVIALHHASNQDIAAILEKNKITISDIHAINKIKLMVHQATDAPAIPAALIGSSLMSLPPLAASGFNASLADCQLLHHNQTLTNLATPLAEQIANYTHTRLQKRKPLARLVRLMSNNAFYAPALRGMGISLLSTSSILRSMIISHY